MKSRWLNGQTKETDLQFDEGIERYNLRKRQQQPEGKLQPWCDEPPVMLQCRQKTWKQLQTDHNFISARIIMQLT